jgi:hypothetical protein
MLFEWIAHTPPPLKLTCQGSGFQKYMQKTQASAHHKQYNIQNQKLYSYVD